MEFFVREPDVPVVFVAKFREYGVRWLDGGSSLQQLAFCPWCGVRLPGSLRDRWVEEIEAMGLEPVSPEIPEAYRSEQWWQSHD